MGQLKEAQQENERVRAEKKRLQVEAGEIDGEAREELLAEAKKLKEELLNTKTADGKVPEELLKRLEYIQKRLAHMGLSTDERAAAARKAVVDQHAQKENFSSLRHLWNR